MNKPGYAVKKDGSFWRVVDGIYPLIQKIQKWFAWIWRPKSS